MIVTFDCRKCGTRIEVDVDAGPQVMCAACHAINEVPPPHIGADTTIGGFRLIRRIGRGGMGDVYFAHQTSLNREAAVKVLHRSLCRDPVFVARFLREVRLVARLEHPNIVKAYEAGEDCGFRYLAMAYVDGVTLEQCLRRRGPIPETEALDIALQVARALDYAWREHRLLHRDLKPANIMLDQRGLARLMDFGISRSLTDAPGKVTRAGLIVGTPNYMSPEAIQNQPDLDFRSDLYSLGATLYHVLTGQLPYAGRNFADTLRRRGSLEPLPHPQDANPALSEPCVALLTRMLEPDPARRHESWQALMSDIEQVIRGRMPEPPPSDPTTGEGRRKADSTPMTSPLRRSQLATRVLSRNRRKTIVALVAVAGALLALDIWLVIRMLKRRAERRSSPTPEAPAAGAPPPAADTEPPGRATADSQKRIRRSALRPVAEAPRIQPAGWPPPFRAPEGSSGARCRGIDAA